MLSEAPVVSVHIPVVLRVLADGRAEITASGDTLGEVLDAVGHEYPALRARLGDDVRLGGFEVFLGARPVRELQGLATPIGEAEVVSLVPAVPG